MEIKEAPKSKDWKSAVYAGFFAANGSAFGKFTGCAASDFQIIQNTFLANHIIIIHGLSVVLMIICNVLNWRFFVRALHSTDHNTLFATVMSAASNYFFSFLVGVAFFGEDLSFLSIVGISFIILGLLFLCQDASEAKINKFEKNHGSDTIRNNVSKKDK